MAADPHRGRTKQTCADNQAGAHRCGHRGAGNDGRADADLGQRTGGVGDSTHYKALVPLVEPMRKAVVRAQLGAHKVLVALCARTEFARFEVLQEALDPADIHGNMRPFPTRLVQEGASQCGGRHARQRREHEAAGDARRRGSTCGSGTVAHQARRICALAGDGQPALDAEFARCLGENHPGRGHGGRGNGAVSHISPLQVGVGIDRLAQCMPVSICRACRRCRVQARLQSRLLRAQATFLLSQVRALLGNFTGFLVRGIDRKTRQRQHRAADAQTHRQIECACRRAFLGKRVQDAVLRCMPNRMRIRRMPGAGMRPMVPLRRRRMRAMCRVRLCGMCGMRWGWQVVAIRCRWMVGRWMR